MPDRKPASSSESAAPSLDEQSSRHLPALTRLTPRGEVRVYKEIVSETRTVTVTVRKERLRLERIPARSGAPAQPGGDDSESLVVPLWEEEVEVTTRPVLREVRVGDWLERESSEAARGTRRAHPEHRPDPDGW